MFKGLVFDRQFTKVDFKEGAAGVQISDDFLKTSCRLKKLREDMIKPLNYDYT